jgi:hypothetical protein
VRPAAITLEVEKPRVVKPEKEVMNDGCKEESCEEAGCQEGRQEVLEEEVVRPSSIVS